MASKKLRTLISIHEISADVFAMDAYSPETKVFRNPSIIEYFGGYHIA